MCSIEQVHVLRRLSFPSSDKVLSVLNEGLCEMGSVSTKREAMNVSFQILTLYILLTDYSFHSDHTFSSRISFVK
jgi:hypothetical protein